MSEESKKTEQQLDQRKKDISTKKADAKRNLSPLISKNKSNEKISHQPGKNLNDQESKENLTPNEFPDEIEEQNDQAAQWKAYKAKQRAKNTSVKSTDDAPLNIGSHNPPPNTPQLDENENIQVDASNLQSVNAKPIIPHKSNETNLERREAFEKTIAKLNTTLPNQKFSTKWSNDSSSCSVFSNEKGVEKELYKADFSNGLTTFSTVDEEQGLTAVLETLRNSGEEFTLNLSGSDEEKYQGLKELNDILKNDNGRYSSKIKIDPKVYSNFENKKFKALAESLKPRTAKETKNESKETSTVDPPKSTFNRS